MSATDPPADPNADTADRRDERKVQLTEQEVDTLEFHAASLRDELLIRFGARCGLRVSEIVGWERPDGERVPGVRPRDLRERDVDGDLPCWPCYRDGFDVPNPRGKGGVWCPPPPQAGPVNPPPAFGGRPPRQRGRVPPPPACGGLFWRQTLY